MNNTVKHWLIGLLLAAALAPAMAAPAIHKVVIEAMRFSPARLEVKAGDTVVWVNADPFAHDVAASGLRSGPIPAGGRWTWKAARRASYAYHCELHPTMQGELIVR